jgi:hypothetical protein
MTPRPKTQYSSPRLFNQYSCGYIALPPRDGMRGPTLYKSSTSWQVPRRLTKPHYPAPSRSSGLVGTSTQSHIVHQSCGWQPLWKESHSIPSSNATHTLPIALPGLQRRRRREFVAPPTISNYLQPTSTPSYCLLLGQVITAITASRAWRRFHGAA